MNNLNNLRTKNKIVLPLIVSRIWDDLEKIMYYDISILKNGIKFFDKNNKLLFLEWKEVNYTNFLSERFTFMLGFPFKHRNGKEIFEGDLLKIKSGTSDDFDYYLVNFRSGCFMADNIKNGKDHNGFEIWETIVWHDLMEGGLLIENMGNIYQNPELKNL